MVSCLLLAVYIFPYRWKTCFFTIDVKMQDLTPSLHPCHPCATGGQDKETNILGGTG